MIRFGRCHLDVAARELTRDGEPVHLEPQAFDLLVHLVEHRDHVLAKTDLLDGVWGHRFVSEAALTTRIKEIRRAVGDDGSTQHTVRNIRGRGYRFVAEVVDGRLEAAHPASSAQLIGRDRECEALRAVLRGPGLVTLLGPGGVGKSTLARAAVAWGDHDRSDGVHVVELATLTSGAEILPALARAVDVVVEAGGEAPAIRAVARLDALVVLDNCEHVVDDVAVLVDRLLATPGARLAFLATSQVRLGCAGERVVTVAPLGRDESVELFVARAAATRPDWRPADLGDDRVAMLVDHLDRLPLTVEMAAARLGAMTYDELDASIREHGQLVQVTHRTPTRRHRTLVSLVEWSADLLSDEQRRAFTELSVFAGAFEATDAGRVLAPDAPADASPIVVELADRSLLAVDLGGRVARYRMLDTVKAVARRWPTPAGPDGPHARHARFVLGATGSIRDGLTGPDEAAARTRLDDLVAEIRQAHRWATEHDPELASRISAHLHLPAYGTFWREPAAWSAALIARHDEGHTGRFPGAQVLVAGAATHAGDLAQARSLLQRVLDHPEHGADPRLRGIALEVLSDVAIYEGDLALAEEACAELASIGRQIGDVHMVALAGVNACLAPTFAGDPDTGLARWADIDATAGSPSDRAWHAYALGEIMAELGRTDEAIAAYAGAIERARAARNPFVVSVSQQATAAQMGRRRAGVPAIEVYLECLRDHLRHGNLVHAVTTVRNAIELLAGLGDDRAAFLLAAAVTGDHLRASYGPEHDRRAAIVESIEARHDPALLTAWRAEGGSLDVEQTVRLAVDLLRAHV